MARDFLLVLLGIIIYGFSGVEGLMCVQCMAPCPDPLPEPTNCTREDETYCKKIGALEGYFTEPSRVCSTPPGKENDLAFCMGKNNKETCMWYCKEDGCNSAPTSFTPTGKWTILAAGTSLLIFVSNGIF